MNLSFNDQKFCASPTPVTDTGHKNPEYSASLKQWASICGRFQQEWNSLRCRFKAQQRRILSFCSQIRAVMSGDTLCGWRFTTLDAISECFTSTGAFNEDALPFAPSSEGRSWCGRGLFFTAGFRGPVTHGCVPPHHLLTLNFTRILCRWWRPDFNFYTRTTILFADCKKGANSH